MDLEGKTRREFIASSLAATASAILADDVLAQRKPKKAPSLDDLPILKRRRITWDTVKKAHDQYQGMNDRQKAASQKGYHTLISKYIDQVLVDEFQIVHDPRRNPYGFMSNWYLFDDKKKRDEVTERMKKEWTAGPAAAEEIIKLFDATNIYWISPMMPGFEVRSGEKRGFVIVNDTLFKLANEYELFSTIDHMRENAMRHEFKPKFGDKEWDDKDTGSAVYRTQIACLQGSIAQVANILSGKRKVSDAFASKATRSYEFLYNNSKKFAADIEALAKRTGIQPKVNNAQLFSMILADAEERFGKLGYEHRLSGGKYELVKK